MIKFSDAELTSVLPAYIKDNPDIRAISYAFQMGMKKMIKYAEKSSLYADIDHLPEKLVDLMALELQSQYYDEALNIQTKREIVKNTLAWYEKAGTVEAVQQMVQTIFGEGSVIEWYDFLDGAGKPGSFDILTDAIITDDLEEKLTQAIRRVKNASSHMRYARVRKMLNTHVIFGRIQIINLKTSAEPDTSNIKIPKNIQLNNGIAIGKCIKVTFQPERGR